MNRFSEIETIVTGMKVDFEKFYEGNNAAAGTRVRKAMQDIKTLAQDIRLEVQNMKNSSAEPAGAAKAAPKAAAPKAAPAKKK
jgi:hypothetical protein